jgi:hypothetical protein
MPPSTIAVRPTLYAHPRAWSRDDRQSNQVHAGRPRLQRRTFRWESRLLQSWHPSSRGRKPTSPVRRGKSAE